MSKENQGFFSKNLNRLLKMNNIQKVALAKHLGFERSAVTNYTKGQTPRMDTVIKIASFFGVSVDSLINGEISDTTTFLNENDKLVYNIPVFNNILNSDTVIYRDDSFFGNITSPLPVNFDEECYAVILPDDSMQSFGMSKRCIAIYASLHDAEVGDIAAVFIKAKKQVVIRSIKSKDKKLVLLSDNGIEEYKFTKKTSDAVILGKVITATFNPNNK